MLPPDRDEADRRPMWDALQVLRMDTDPEPLLAGVARLCARSKYSLAELEAIQPAIPKQGAPLSLRAGPGCGVAPPRAGPD